MFTSKDNVYTIPWNDSNSSWRLGKSIRSGHRVIARADFAIRRSSSALPCPIHSILSLCRRLLARLSLSLGHVDNDYRCLCILDGCDKLVKHIVPSHAKRPTRTQCGIERGHQKYEH